MRRLTIGLRLHSRPGETDDRPGFICYSVNMLTRCPYADCLETFEHPEVRVGSCAKCARPMSLRDLDIILELDKRIARMQQQGLEPGAVHSPARARGSTGISAIIEDVRSLWNVGSVFRTADGAGIDRLILCGITGTPPRKEIAKVSLGAEETVEWLYYPSVLDAIDEQRRRGDFILGLEHTTKLSHLSIEDSINLHIAIKNGQIRFPLTLIAGNEVTGVSAEALSNCDLICELPMRGMKESLNVAVAFGIAGYMLAQHYAESVE